MLFAELFGIVAFLNDIVPISQVSQALRGGQPQIAREMGPVQFFA